MKHTTFEYGFDNFDLGDDGDYGYIKLPYHNSGKKKVLFVLDWMPSEDLKSGKLLSGQTGDLLEALVKTAHRMFGKGSATFSWCAITYNAFRTIGKPADFIAQAEEAFAERIKEMIGRYKPDYVVTFGPKPLKYLASDKLAQNDNGTYSYLPWMGVPINREINKHKFVLVPNHTLSRMHQAMGQESLLGFVVRWLAPLFGKVYHIPKDDIDNQRFVCVDTISKFKKLIAHAAKERYVAFDTESTNLTKLCNQLQSVQMAFDSRTGYIVPIAHRDTPFTPKEIRYILDTFKDYFEGANSNEYHIYVNAKFDLTLLRQECGIEYFHNDVWDCLAGEFCIDENGKDLNNSLGEWYYKLGTLAVQYGFEGYLTASFSKQHRAHFATTDLNDDVLQYAAYDVTIPFAIHELQKQRAKDLGYAKYEKVVRHELSDTIHAFSIMEHTGVNLDSEYLFYLRTPESPITKEIEASEAKLLDTKAGRKAAKAIGTAVGRPEGGFGDIMAGFNAVSKNDFNINKPDHLRRFFFEVLQLEPLEIGANGEGKLDKKFQSHYADVPEVAAYTSLNKAKKLRDAFVKSFLNKMKEDPDLQKDGRIRPSFGYAPVVTHRTCARDPNLQQVPARGKLGKLIKRLFVARRGTLYIKVDYRVHEVRGWGLISGDSAVAKVFLAAKALRDAYRLHPTSELARRVDTEADIHRANAVYFFNKTIDEVIKNKELRDAVKGVIFGLIYGMGMGTLAKNIKQSKEFTEELVEKFVKRFPKAMSWTKAIKKFAKENFYAEAPTGIRRNLWAYLIPESFEEHGKMWSRADRQAGNAPIQGMCSKMMMSGIRILNRSIYKIRKKRKDFELYITNSVHDSAENEAGYRSFIKSLGLIEKSLTVDVTKRCKDIHNFELVCDTEIDFEIGATLMHCEGWDFSLHQLDRLVMSSLLVQRNELGHEIDVNKTYRLIFDQFDEDATDWMLKQRDNLGYTFNLTEAKYIAELMESAEAAVAVTTKAVKEATMASKAAKDSEVKEEAGKKLANATKEYLAACSKLDDVKALKSKMLEFKEIGRARN